MFDVFDSDGLLQKDLVADMSCWLSKEVHTKKCDNKNQTQTKEHVELFNNIYCGMSPWPVTVENEGQ